MQKMKSNMIIKYKTWLIFYIILIILAYFYPDYKKCKIYLFKLFIQSSLRLWKYLKKFFQKRCLRHQCTKAVVTDQKDFFKIRQLPRKS